MKKLMFLVLVVVVLAAGFVSCAKGPSQLVINSYMSDEKPKAAFQAEVDAFQKANPGIKVTVNTTAHEQFKTLLSSYLTSKDAPDIVSWFAGYRMQSFAAKGLLEPIDTVFPGGSIDKEFPKAFKGASSYMGKVYFMPQSWYWWAVYYNKDVFAKIGVKEAPKTWDDFLKVCEAAKKAGIAPVTIGAKDTWTTGGWFDYVNAAVNGGDAHQKLTGGSVAYTDPSVKESFKILADLSSKGYLLKNAASLSWQEAVTPLVEGKAAMYLMGQFIMDSVPAAKKSSIDFFAFPMIKQTTYSVDTPTDGFMMPKNAKNKDNAKKFLAFLASKESQARFCGTLGRLAANVNVPISDPITQKGADMVKGAALATQFYDRDAPEEMAAKGMNAIVDIWANPAKMDEILANLDKERVRIYADLK